MLSQADSVSLRPAQAKALPNTWGHLMAETSASLSVKYEDRDTQVTADDSALQRRAARMNKIAQRYNKAGPAVTAVDVVDAWGYYAAQQSSSDEDNSGRQKTIGKGGGVGRTGGAGGRGGISTPGGSSSKPTGSTSGGLRWRDQPAGSVSFQSPHNAAGAPAATSSRRGLLTPPSVFEHNALWFDGPSSRPQEVPPAHGGGVSQSFTPRFGREVLPPPNMF